MPNYIKKHLVFRVFLQPQRFCNGQPCGEATLKAVQHEVRSLTNLLCFTLATDLHCLFVACSFLILAQYTFCMQSIPKAK